MDPDTPSARGCGWAAIGFVLLFPVAILVSRLLHPVPSVEEQGAALTRQLRIAPGALRMHIDSRWITGYTSRGWAYNPTSDASASVYTDDSRFRSITFGNHLPVVAAEVSGGATITAIGAGRLNADSVAMRGYSGTSAAHADPAGQTAALALAAALGLPVTDSLGRQSQPRFSWDTPPAAPTLAMQTADYLITPYDRARVLPRSASVTVCVATSQIRSVYLTW